VGFWLFFKKEVRLLDKDGGGSAELQSSTSQTSHYLDQQAIGRHRVT
jgi:hypothetical protein